MVDLVSTYKDAGFSDQEISEHLSGLRQNYQQAGFSDEEIDQHFGIPRTPQNVPPPLLDRIEAGKNIGHIFETVAEGAKKGFGEEPLGPNENLYELLQGWGVLAKDGVEPLVRQKLAWSAMAAIDTLMRAPGVNSVQSIVCLDELKGTSAMPLEA